MGQGRERSRLRHETAVKVPDPIPSIHPNLRLELRAVHRALLAVTHAIILLGQQLKPASQIWGPL